MIFSLISVPVVGADFFSSSTTTTMITCGESLPNLE